MHVSSQGLPYGDSKHADTHKYRRFNIFSLATARRGGVRDMQNMVPFDGKQSSFLPSNSQGFSNMHQNGIQIRAHTAFHFNSDITDGDESY
jgi:hypothetical protein